MPLTLELRRYYKMSVDVSGAMVTSVTSNTPADRMGLMPGMLITRVNDQPVDGPDTLTALVRQVGPGGEVVITFRDKNGEGHSREFLAGAPPRGPNGAAAVNGAAGASLPAMPAAKGATAAPFLPGNPEDSSPSVDCAAATHTRARGAHRAARSGLGQKERRALSRA